VHEAGKFFATRATDAANCRLIIHQENLNHLQTSYLLYNKAYVLKHQVRFTAEAFNLNVIMKSIGVQEFSKQHLRLCVLAFNAGHIIAAFFFGVDICHLPK
jgi:hypothetical protein